MVTDIGASEELDEAFADVAVSEPGTPEREAAINRARAVYQAERKSGTLPGTPDPTPQV